MAHPAWVMRGLHLFVAPRQSDLQMPRIGSQKIINLIDRILHSFRLLVYNPTDCLIVMHTRKRERNMLHYTNADRTVAPCRTELGHGGRALAPQPKAMIGGEEALWLS